MEQEFEPRLEPLFSTVKAIDQMWDRDDMTFCVFRKNSDQSVSFYHANLKYMHNMKFVQGMFEHSIEEVFGSRCAAILGDFFEHDFQEGQELQYVYEIPSNEKVVFWQVSVTCKGQYIVFWGRKISLAALVKSCCAKTVDFSDFLPQNCSTQFLMRTDNGYALSDGSKASLNEENAWFLNSFRAIKSFLDACMRENVPICYLSFVEQDGKRTYLSNLLMPVVHQEAKMMMVRIEKISLHSYFELLETRVFILWEKIKMNPDGRAIHIEH